MSATGKEEEISSTSSDGNENKKEGIKKKRKPKEKPKNPRSPKSKQKKKAQKQISQIIRRLRKFSEEPEMAAITAEEINIISLRVREQLMLDSTCLELQPPIVVVGDIHGQFSDLCAIFEQNGYPPKIVYGFYDEIVERFSRESWELIQRAFNCLPICGRIGRRIFCMHGGISKDLNAWQQLGVMRRPMDVPDFGVVCDLLWADPDPDRPGYNPSPRGVSLSFGEDALKEFCFQHGLDLIIRAHQVVQNGYEMFANRHLVTIFSAPYYCEEFDNVAAVMTIDQNLQCRFRLRHPVEIEKRTRQRMLKTRKNGIVDEPFPIDGIGSRQLSKLPPPPDLPVKETLTVSVQQNLSDIPEDFLKSKD